MTHNFQSKNGDFKFKISMGCNHPNMTGNNTESIGCNGNCEECEYSIATMTTPDAIELINRADCNSVRKENKQITTKKVYMKKDRFIHVDNNKEVPCLLFVSTEILPKKGLKISVRGKENPFPFREAIIQVGSTTIDCWLSQYGYTEIGRNYVY